MTSEIEMSRELHCNRMQDVLEEGLRAIVAAQNSAEAERARQAARTRLADLITLRRNSQEAELQAARQAG